MGPRVVAMVRDVTLWDLYVFKGVVHWYLDCCCNLYRGAVVASCSGHGSSAVGSKLLLHQVQDMGPVL